MKKKKASGGGGGGDECTIWEIREHTVQAA
jgi:hypothetical protein